MKLPRGRRSPKPQPANERSQPMADKISVKSQGRILLWLRETHKRLAES